MPQPPPPTPPSGATAPAGQNDYYMANCVDLLEATSLLLSTAMRLHSMARSEQDSQRLRETIMRLRADSVNVHNMLAGPLASCAGQQALHHV